CGGEHGGGADGRLRPLRLLPADLSDLRAALAAGDGLAARADLVDERPRRGHARTHGHGRRALRPLPRVHGLRHLLPFRRAVRPADRADAGSDRGATRPCARRLAPASARLLGLSTPAAAAGGPRARAARARAAAPALVPAARRARAALALVGVGARAHAGRRSATRARRPAARL